MATDETESPENAKRATKESEVSIESERNEETLFSPRFRSVAAMAGWDEEALLFASLIVEDTPERESKQKKRVNSHFKTPPPSSRRKRRARRVSPSSVPTVVLDLDDEENIIKSKDSKCNAMEEKKRDGGGKDIVAEVCVVSSSTSALPCMDRLREELSCAICLEICFEPSTTPCGHSFCKKCLKSAADKCGKRCPKCRQLIGNGRSCTVNTVLWNTIQLLFPQEVEARKPASATKSHDKKNREAERRSPENHGYNVRSRRARPSMLASRDVNVRRRRGLVSQDEDAALALRLQREEFMEVYRGTPDEQWQIPNISSARANLRAMASRAINLRIRGRPAYVA